MIHDEKVTNYVPNVISTTLLSPCVYSQTQNLGQKDQDIGIRLGKWRSFQSKGLVSTLHFYGRDKVPIKFLSFSDVFLILIRNSNSNIRN